MPSGQLGRVLHDETDMRRPTHTTEWPAVILIAILTACGEDATAPTSPDSLTPAATAVQAPSFLELAAGWYHTCGIATDGRAWCWGLNRDGELGDGTTTDRSTPTRVKTTLVFRQISAGAFSTCGITTDSRAVCWGFGGDGQLGTGTTARHLTPVAVTGDRKFRDVRVGNRHACGVTTASVGYCWGYNTNGQLGDGTTTRRLKPVRVAGSLVFVRVKPGTDHTCGLTTDAHAYCWGYNFYGQVGTPTNAGSLLLPYPVDASIGTLRQATAGDQHSCAVTTSNVAYCWGRSFHGESGSGFSGVFYLPLKVNAGTTKFLGVSPGGGHTCGVSTQNLAYCWGSNGSGQLGSVTGGADRLSPTAVSGGLKFKAIYAGLGHTCGVTLAYKAYCWGNNQQGQLGNANRGTGSAVPVAVVGG
jgi:alpha-tubulin suppressor-like RCC1 family protein